MTETRFQERRTCWKKRYSYLGLRIGKGGAFSSVSS